MPRTTRRTTGGTLASLRTPKARALLIVAAVGVAAIAAWGGPGGGGTAAPSDAAAVDYVRSHRLDLGAPGLAVAIVHTDHATAAGAGDATADTPIIIGSATKSFTALAVLQLAEAGRLSLDQPAVHYVADFRTSNSAVSDRITIRQLLSHTSGLSTAAGVDPLAGPETTLHGQVLALRALTAATPGSFVYSNANYEVLGDVVEQVGGTSYAQYLQTHVLTPLGMTHTYTDLTAARDHGLRPGHRIWFGVGVDGGYWYRADFLPAGFLVSTAADLARYLGALLEGGRYPGGRVLSEAGVRALTTSSTAADLWGVQGGYGFGWYTRPNGGQDLVVDPGITRGTHADLVLVPQRHLGVVVLADAESPLYLVSIPRFDLLAMNVAGIAADGAAPSGLVEGFNLIFDLITVAALALYTTVLVRVLRSRRPGLAAQPWYRLAVTLWRELLVPLVILLRLPGLADEPWPSLVRQDVGLVAALVAGLGLAAMAARGVFALRLASGRRAAAGSAGASLATVREDLPLTGAGR